MRYRAWCGGAAAVALGAAFLQCGGCSSVNEAGPIAADGGERDDGPALPRQDATTGMDPPPRPSSVPAGWDLYGDYDPECGFYIPSEPKYLPEPIRWERCETLARDAGLPGPDSLVCRRMVLDWEPHPNHGQHIAPSIPAWNAPRGVSLYLRRMVGKNAYALVAGVDGPVESAVFESGKCSAPLGHAAAGNVMHRVRDNPSSQTDKSGGAFGGPVDTLRPRVYFPKGTSPSPYVSTAYYVGATMFVQNFGAASVYSFATGNLIAPLVPAPEDSDVRYGLYQFQGDDLFWIGNSARRTIVKVWTAAGGMQTLIGHGYDYSRAVIGFGTDGVDMVWTEAFGRIDQTVQIYPQVETWTARYTTSPGVVASTKRRLRSEYPNGYTANNVVGCGYVAHAISPPSTWGKRGFRLIRISDGTSWEVSDESEVQKFNFNFHFPLAVTCDEVFVEGSTGSHIEVARIRIDSLGPGIPAD